MASMPLVRYSHAYGFFQTPLCSAALVLLVLQLSRGQVRGHDRPQCPQPGCLYSGDMVDSHSWCQSISDVRTPSSSREAITPKTRLIHLESPRSSECSLYVICRRRLNSQSAVPSFLEDGAEVESQDAHHRHQRRLCYCAQAGGSNRCASKHLPVTVDWSVLLSVTTLTAKAWDSCQRGQHHDAASDLQATHPGSASQSSSSPTLQQVP